MGRSGGRGGWIGAGVEGRDERDKATLNYRTKSRLDTGAHSSKQWGTHYNKLTMVSKNQ